ncbi:MAG: MBL fold metallo-hydrolase [Atribacterota bacterium]|jgi:7,8-dihydropterin-6-yl-methyl-4-(beta-D-ribofuranosyl)aminobenzene 5'-phosphate synthase|nr:MBL fold metallo-hydrolase [Atribacterota bacterium]MDD4896648.1 MBL fold metallo-hydrolase [Atribacterota bacterium]MDD5637122.1 MBL fold metallo-hydrolase [Atribacterota bacterium]
MEIKATVLCENCIYFNSGVIAEHGWSAYIETKYGNFLFDTGQGIGIINNAHHFHKDLSNLQGIIISHHHHDHTGGLLRVLDYARKVKVYSHPALFKNSFNIRNGVERNIGIPYRREVLESKGAEFIFNTSFIEIAPGLMLSGEIPRRTSFEKGDPDLLLKNEQGYLQDIVIDDQTLIMNTKKGLVIVLGCSHSGIINIINYIIEKTGQKHIHTIFGGTHLGPLSEKSKAKSIEALKKFDIERIGTSHCTGLETSMRLLQEFGKRFFFCNVGTVIKV